MIVQYQFSPRHSQMMAELVLYIFAFLCYT